jgi:hypothetical protein
LHSHWFSAKEAEFCCERATLLICRSADSNSEISGLPDPCPQLLRPDPGIAAVNDPPKEPELFPDIGPITTNVIS